MTTLSERVQNLNRQVDHLLGRIAKLSQYPEDTFSNGTVLKFKKQFEGRGSVKYNYAAIKVNGLWYTTGHNLRTPKGITWEELIDWMGEGVNQIKVATSWKNIL